MDDDIKKELSEIRKEIKELKESVDILREICSKMDHHIDFIQTTYTKVRAPMDYVCTKVNNMMGIRGDCNLEQIKKD
jgi:DNA anti-recombination protein RmuC